MIRSFPTLEIYQETLKFCHENNFLLLFNENSKYIIIKSNAKNSVLSYVNELIISHSLGFL
jgi:hypothetical protein